jgi:hypothetical protein
MFIPLEEEDPFASYWDDVRRCWDCRPKDLSFTKRAQFYLDYYFSVVPI